MIITKNTSQKDVLKLGKICKQCGHCCSYASGFADEKEIITIAKHLNISKEKLMEKYFEKTQVFNKEVYKPKTKKKPFGPCIFLKCQKLKISEHAQDKVLTNNKCEIHDVKPLHCRVGNCNEHGEHLSEWFTSNFLVDPNNPESIRQWATRVDLKPTIKGAHPQDLVKDKKKLREILEYKRL